MNPTWQNRPPNSVGVIHLNVQGIHYSVFKEDLERFPESYFTHMLSDDWTSDPDQMVCINRDCEIFRHVFQYLSIDEEHILGMRWLKRADLDSVLLIRQEADFFNLSALVAICDDRILEQIYQSLDKAIDKPCNSHTEPFSEQFFYNLSMASQIPILTCDTSTVCDQVKWNKDRPSVEYALERSNPVEGSSFRNCFTPRCCLDVPSSVAFGEKLEGVCPLLSPFACMCARRKHFPNVQMYTRGGYCTNHILPISHAEMYGVVLYIFNNSFTGGVVSATIHGVTISISKPGECMLLRAGCSYSVSEVTSGELVLVQYNLYISLYDHQKSCCIEWVDHTPVTSRCDMTMKQELLEELSAELTKYDGVALCLPHYYPVMKSECTSRRFETDETVLLAHDRELISLLLKNFSTTLVTVSIESHSNGGLLQGCILDYENNADESDCIKILIPPADNSETLGSDCRLYRRLVTAVLLCEKISLS